MTSFKQTCLSFLRFTITDPCDLIQVLLNVQRFPHLRPTFQSPYPNAIKMLVGIQQNQGFTALYSGAMFGFLHQSIQGLLNTYLSPILEQLFFQPLNETGPYSFVEQAVAQFLIAFLRNIIHSMVLHPIEALKIRYMLCRFGAEVDYPAHYTTVDKLMRLYQGFMINTLYLILERILRVAILNYLYRIWETETGDYRIFMTSEMFGGFISVLILGILYPLITVKNYQITSPNKIRIIDIIKRIYNEEGLIGFYHGILSACVIKFVNHLLCGPAIKYI